MTSPEQATEQPLRIRRIVGTHRVELPVSGTLFRTPPRPIERMQADYMNKYDGLTLASDVFVEGSTLHVVGPPLFNLSEALEDLEVWCSLSAGSAHASPALHP